MGGGKNAGDGPAFRNPHNLPVKVCVTCNRPFTWRKKWEKCWDEVLTCSNRCKTTRKAAGRQGAGREPEEPDDSDGSDAVEADLAHARPKNSGRGKKGGKAAAAGLAVAAVAQEEELADGAATQKDLEGQLAAAVAAKDFANAALISAELAKIQEKGGDAPSDTAALPEPADASPPATGSTARAKQEIDLEDEEEEEKEEEEESLSMKELKRRERKERKERKEAQRARKNSPSQAAIAKRKPCDICSKRVDLLIRCTIDKQQKWHMVCGRCWKDVSGGVPDGDADHPHYRYGGIWKNRKAGDIQTPKFGSKLSQPSAEKILQAPGEDDALDALSGA